MTKASSPPAAGLQAAVHSALRLWHKPSAAGSPLADLYLFQALKRDGLATRQATNQLLLQALEQLEREQAEQVELLRKRFVDGLAMHVLSNQRNMVESSLFALQKQAILRLTELLAAMDSAARRAQQIKLEQRLKPHTYTEIVGVEAALQALATLLTAREAPWLVSLEGIGGIGKTSLADALLRQVIQEGRLEEFGWVSAQPVIFNLGGALTLVDHPALTVEALVEALVIQLLGDRFASATFSLEAARTALTARLKQQPHLIVIDNLETIADVASLLPTLRGWMAPSKFLLTSRQSLYREPDVYRFVVPELSEPHALHLVRLEARLRNLPHLAHSSDEALRPLYETVGGNPLALRLVVGQTHVHDLGAILSDLATARGATPERLYDFIYRRAWEHLDEVTRRAFLALPLVPERGGPADFLAEVSGLSLAELRHALDHLVEQNLVDVQGELGARRYTIHNLTRTFLQEGVAQWHVG